MLTSYKNSTVIKTVLVSSIILGGLLSYASPAGATDEPLPDPTPIATPLTNEDIFFSQPRQNPYSDAELQHEPNAAELRGDSWESRVANCKTLVDYNAYADCMFRPWLYGY